ncbi:MAG: SRPBCC family protein [Telmatospirillum sp.]|nr:SRPBCC family protein [Telmatospirillum sp.]
MTPPFADSHDARITHDEPEMLRLTRLLPGTIDRVWAYLTQSDLRATWLGAGSMDLRPGATVTLAIDNTKLTPSADNVPPNPATQGGPKTLVWRVVESEAPHLLVVDWGTAPDASRVRFELAAEGTGTRLTIEHRRVASRGMLLGVSAGWHTHTDILRDRLAGHEPAAFWPRYAKLETLYAGRLPG